jgi:hypothetical protein
VETVICLILRLTERLTLEIQKREEVKHYFSSFPTNHPTDYLDHFEQEAEVLAFLLSPLWLSASPPVSVLVAVLLFQKTRSDSFYGALKVSSPRVLVGDAYRVEHNSMQCRRITASGMTCYPGLLSLRCERTSRSLIVGQEQINHFRISLGFCRGVDSILDIQM